MEFQNSEFEMSELKHLSGWEGPWVGDLGCARLFLIVYFCTTTESTKRTYFILFTIIESTKLLVLCTAYATNVC